MRIAVIAADLVPEKLGGAEQHIVEVIKRLSARHKFHLFVGKDTSSAKIFKGNVEVYPIFYPKISNFYGLAYIFFGYKQIKKVLEVEKIDLLWAKQSYPQAPLAALLKRKFQIPLYTTVQNPMLHKEELVMKGKIFTPFLRIFYPLLTGLICWSYKNSDITACVSNYSANLAKRMGAKKIKNIPNGVDITRFKKRKTNHREQVKSIVTSSSLIPRNGLDILIKSLFLLPKKISWKLKIAGEGNEKKKLQKLIKRLGLQSKITLIGRINNTDIPEFLSKAHIFVRLSRNEGFGVSFIEAMASGVPIVATRVGGITDFTINRKTGILVEPNNPRQASKAISQLLTDKKLYSKLKKNGLELVKNKYNWDKITNEVEKAFYSLKQK